MKTKNLFPLGAVRCSLLSIVHSGFAPGTALTHQGRLKDGANPATEDYGFLAQDFYAAVGLNGDDDKHIATVDANGVALVTIQGLNERLEEKDAELQAIKQTVAELKAAFDQLGHAPL